MQITADVLGAGLVVLGTLMLWVWMKPDRNTVSRMVFKIYQRTTFGMPVTTYLLVAGLILVSFGGALIVGLIG